MYSGKMCECKMYVAKMGNNFPLWYFHNFILHLLNRSLIAKKNRPICYLAFYPQRRSEDFFFLFGGDQMCRLIFFKDFFPYFKTFLLLNHICLLNNMNGLRLKRSTEKVHSADSDTFRGGGQAVHQPLFWRNAPASTYIRVIFARSINRTDI